MKPLFEQLTVTELFKGPQVPVQISAPASLPTPMANLPPEMTPVPTLHKDSGTTTFWCIVGGITLLAIGIKLFNHISNTRKQIVNQTLKNIKMRTYEYDEVKAVYEYPVVKSILIGGTIVLLVWGGRYFLNSLAEFIRSCTNVVSALRGN